MIESIVIRNLCGIEQGRLGPFGRVNLFMGPKLFYATFERHNLDFWLEEGLDPRKW